MKPKPTSGQNPPSSLNYRAAGVDIDAGNALVEKIKPACASTKRAGVMSAIGGFGGLFDLQATGYSDPLLVAATDGVGTKLKLALDTGIHHTVGIDLVAMCVNDLVVQGAEPLFFLDYYACGSLETDVAAAVIEGIAEGCRQAGCALIGGETAEMPGMYAKGDYDLAGFAVGAVERDKVLPRTDDMQVGDVILGLASSGVHSNGFSLVRKVLEVNNASFGDDAPVGGTFGEWLLTPTRIYVNACLQAIRETGAITGLAHITGGGLSENIPRVLPDHLAASITLGSWDVSPIFSWLQSQGNIPEDDMLRTFNCGIGMAIICAADQAEMVHAVLEAQGERVFQIGTLISRNPALPAVQYAS